MNLFFDRPLCLFNEYSVKRQKKRYIFDGRLLYAYQDSVHFLRAELFSLVFRAFSFPIFDTSRSNIRSTHVARWRKPGPLKLRGNASEIPPLFVPWNPRASLFHGKWPLSFPPPISKLSKFPFEKVCSGSRWDRTHPSLDYTSPSLFLKHLSGNRSSSRDFFLFFLERNPHSFIPSNENIKRMEISLVDI